MKYLISLILVFAFTSGYSQSDFGFADVTIIYKKGDSIRCQIKREISYGDTITYKANENAREKFILSKEIKGIRFSFKYLENINFDKIEKLLTLLVEGKINLYNYLELKYGEAVNMTKPNGIMFRPQEEIVHYILKSGVDYIEIKEGSFHQELIPLIKDCPSLGEKIGSNGYMFEDMVQIIKEFNSCQ